MSLELLEFKSAIRAAGLEPPADLIADGVLHRFHVDGDKPGSENGWYVLYPEGAGAFGCWKRDINQKWHVSRFSDPEQQETLRIKHEELRRITEFERDKKHAETRAKASEIYKVSEPASDDHPYLVKKTVQAFKGLKFSKGSLVVPLRDISGQIHGLQFIDSGGNKRFLSGTAKKGNYSTFAGTHSK